VFIPRPRASTNVAPKIPKTETPREQDGPERTGQQRREIDGQEARGPDRRFEDPAEDVEREHVEAEMHEPGVEETAGDQAIQLAVGDAGAEQPEVRDQRVRGAVETA
jgi:hypothetical protein